MRLIFRLPGKPVTIPEGPVVITPNHASFLDPPALAAAIHPVSRRRVTWAGWTGIMFRNGPLRVLSRCLRVLPVDAEHGPVSTLAFALAALKAGNALVWFPEGRRSFDGTLQDFKPGIGALMEQMPEAILLPVWIQGTHEALPPNARRLRRTSVTLNWGKPVFARELLKKASGDPRLAAEELRSRLAELSTRGPEAAPAP
jgi:long-chain acyl-CoA synthetase